MFNIYINIMFFVQLSILISVLSINISTKKSQISSEVDITGSKDNYRPKQLPQNKLTEILHKGYLFRDLFSEQLSPQKIEFGYVCENPNEWEQRFEHKDFENNRFQGKIKWSNKNGEYGEHYWDLNH